MAESSDHELDTTGGKFRLFDYRLRQDGREWTILHTGAVLTDADETRAIVRKTNRLPYGVALWPSAIALAHEIASRAPEFRGRTVLELGAGTGLPGIIAASAGARVVQTDKEELVLHLCRKNGERNDERIAYRLADWTAWDITDRYDWIIGADILYGESLHPQVRAILAANAAGRVLLSDPFRGMALRFFEGLEADGWGVRYNQWDVGTEKPVGVFELTPPCS